MQRLYKYDKGSDFRLNCVQINSITLYDDNGIVHHLGNGSRLYDENGEEVEKIEVLQIKQHAKSFRKEETEKAFINKMMKEKINFSYISKEKTWWHKEDKLELFLYVDNEFIKVVEKKNRTTIDLQDYDFSKSYSYYEDITVDFDGQIAKHSDCIKYERVEQKDLQEHAKAIFDEVVKISYINESEFNRIFNQYKLVKRDTPLLVKEF